MPFSSGVYTAPASTWNPPVAGTEIETGDWITLLADIVAALTNAVCKDGQSTCSAAIPFAAGVQISNGGLKQYDSNSSHLVTLNVLTNVTANRTWNFDFGDAARTLTLAADLTLPADPNADTIFGWDDSTGLTAYFSLGTGLTTSGTTFLIDVAVVVTLTGAQTLTNKILTAADINGGTADSLTSLSIRSSGAAFDLLFAMSEAISANRTITWNVGNAARSITLGGDISLGTALTLPADPNADRIFGWDDSAGLTIYFSLGTGLATSGTTFSLSHLGLEALVDPNADRMAFWDDSAGAFAWLTAGAGLTITTTTITVDVASLTVAGIVEIATSAETNTGTDAGRALSPDGFAGSNFGIRYFGVPCFGPGSDCSTGDGKNFFHVPAGLNGMNLVSVHGGTYTAGTTNTMDIQVRRNRAGTDADMLSTKITIDSTERGSDTAAAPAVINASNDDVATNDYINIDVDAVQTTPAKGLIVTLGFQLP